MKNFRLLSAGLLIVSLLALGLGALACSPEPVPTATVTAPAKTVTAPAKTVTAPAKTVTATAPAEKAAYVWYTPPPGGTLYITTGAMSLVSSDITGIKSFMETVVNCDVLQMAIHQGEADFGQSGFPRVVAGYDGTFANFEGVATNNIRLAVIGPITKTPWYSMKQQADITTWEGLKDKIINGGVTGMYMNFAEATLKYHGIFDDIKELRMADSSADFARSLIEGRVDAAFGWTGTQQYEFDAAGGYNVIEQPAEEVLAIVKEYEQKGWVPVVVNEGEFGSPQAYNTAGIPVALLTGIHVPADDVYAILAAIMDNTEALTSIHEKAGEFDKVDALVGLGCPIHPGAKKWYEENGMWTDALETENQRLLDMWGMEE